VHRRTVLVRSFIAFVAFVAFATLVLEARPAASQAAGTEAVQVTLEYTDPDTNQRTGAGDVEFAVATLDGAEVGSGATDERGVFRLDLPGPGRYVVTIDPETLPEGVDLRDEDRTTATVTVNPGQAANALFALDTGGGAGTDDGIDTRRVLQLTVDGAKLGLYLAMAAIGLSLIFGTTGLTNFAHSEMIGFGLLTAYLFNFYGLAGVFGFLSGLPGPFGDGVNLILATALAVLLGGVLGWLLDALLFAPLRRRGTSLVAQLVFSIGLAILMRYVFLFVFGGGNRFYRDYTAQRAVDVGPVVIAPKDLVAMGITVLVLIGVGLGLQRTRFGKAMRAVADNGDLAASSGIDVQRVIRVVWVASGALAALGGVFIALSEQVSYLTGFRVLLLLFAGVVLGGLGTAFGALVGCVLIGMGIQLSTLFLPLELKNVGALVVLILVLLVRPQGILGRPERIG
jgi:branched-chain amino acid transport system permease protein